jgi:hypothetical protein
MFVELGITEPSLSLYGNSAFNVPLPWMKDIGILVSYDTRHADV